ncbi:MAG TPA: competence/damage-inducible protein A, partial [Burkholderiales bacterium]|nr:competence/damage-inducible protein A [Burkholderiales bacterium]
PDDLTRQCAAQAAGVPLARHPEALALIVEKFGDSAYPKRVLMADFPQGAEIIPNPYNRIPGFSYRRHYFLPGFPEMAWPMMAWVLDTHYAQLFAPGSVAESSIIVREAGESQLIELMKDCQARYRGIKVFSLPKVQPERYIELGVRGHPGEVTPAIAALKQGVSDLGFPWSDAPR